MLAFLMPAFLGSPGGGEILIILLIVLLLFGTKNLPKMARTLGRTLEEFRRAAREVSNEISRADLDDEDDGIERRLNAPDQAVARGGADDYGAEFTDDMQSDDPEHVEPPREQVATTEGMPEAPPERRIASSGAPIDAPEAGEADEKA